MLVQPLSFKGTIKIVGKDSAVYVNRDAVETIRTDNYIDKKEDNSLLNFKIKEGTYLNLTSGNQIKVFAPLEEVLNAYNNSKDSDVELATKYNPLQIDKWL